MKGVTAIIAIILLLVITIALAGIAYMFTQNILKKSTSLVSVDAYCVSGDITNITILAMNEGTSKITASQVKIIKIDSDCTAPATFAEDLEPGKWTNVTLTGCSTGKMHRFRLLTPAGSVPVSVYCS